MEKREQFASRLGFVLVSAGCAVGLGNVWKFPYMCGQYGGAAFILIYLVFLAILGLPIIVCEFAIGRGSKKSVAKAFAELEPENGRWHHYRWLCMAGNYLLMMFYTMVCGWMLYYMVQMASGQLTGVDAAQVGAAFSGMLSQPGTMTFWMLVTVVVSFGICALGLKNGVEKITKVMMIGLIVLMMALAVHSVTLSGAGEGIRFYLVPDFAKVKAVGIGNVVFGALSQAFFTLSIGIGAMAIFGSYLDDSRSLTGEAMQIVLLDTLVALMAGFIVIPACFAYGVEPDAGPPLLFVTLPNVFNDMAGGRVWGTAFFAFMSFAALSTVVAVFENIVSFAMDGLGWSRKKAVAVNFVAVAILSMPAVLGFNLWSGIQPLGEGTTIMDLEDFLVSDNLLPIGSLVFILFCAGKYGWGFDRFTQEANKGEGMHFPAKAYIYVRFILPVIVGIIYLKGYYDKFSDSGRLLAWMAVAVLYLLFVFWLSRPGKRNE